MTARASPEAYVEEGLRLREEERWSIARIMLKYGRSASFWAYRMQRAGIDPYNRHVRPQSGKNKRFTAAADVQLVELRKQGLSFVAIGAAVGWSSSSVRRRLLALAAIEGSDD